MPLPKPSKNAKNKDRFVQNCMANPTMNKDFPKNAQRFAVCQSQWDRRSKTKANLEWEDCAKNGVITLV